MRRWLTGMTIMIFIVVFASAVASAEGSGGQVQLTFKNVVNGIPLELNNRVYINANNDSFTVSMYKYYISNVKLTAQDGSEFIEPESYHLINESKPKSKSFLLSGIPPGKYRKISFYIGVDSLHNVSGAQSGALDAINTMFWDWNTGYIMAKIEGNSNKAPQGTISYHIGGFAGKNNTVRSIVLELGNGIHIGSDQSAAINIISDIAEWFKTPNHIQFEKLPVVATEGEAAVGIADNYADMFTLEIKQ